MLTSLSAAVILIGDELLSGGVQDKNLQYIAVNLEKIGIRVRETRIIPDDAKEIISAVTHLRTKFDYVFTTGGIGPTHDDITSDSIAQAFGVKNSLHLQAIQKLQSTLEKKGLPLTDALAKMAHVPEGAHLIYCKEAVVPAFYLENVFVLAGVPHIMRASLDEALALLPKATPIIKREVHANIREGVIAADLEHIQSQHPAVQIGSYPQEKNASASHYQVIFVVRGMCANELHTVATKIVRACEKLHAEAEITQIDA